jgi:hypothetical protein
MRSFLFVLMEMSRVFLGVAGFRLQVAGCRLQVAGF